MRSLKNRINKLEESNKPAPELKWTEEEKQFQEEIHNRMEKAGTTFYHDVCNDEEFERVRKLSSKACLIYYRNNLKNESNEITEKQN